MPRLHRLPGEVVEPLGDVVFVEIVVFYDVLEEPVDQLANFCHWVVLAEFSDRVEVENFLFAGFFVLLLEFLLEGVVEDVDEKRGYPGFTHETLTLWMGYTLTSVRILRVCLSNEEN